MYALLAVVRGVVDVVGCVETNRIENDLRCDYSLGQAQLPIWLVRVLCFFLSYGRFNTNDCSPSLIDTALARCRSCK
jgi:hypothetical protein